MLVMVGVLNSISSSPGSSPGQGHCVVFLGKTLYSHSASFHPGVYFGTDKFNARGWPCDGLASHPGGSRNTPTCSCFILLLKPEISTWLVCILKLCILKLKQNNMNNKRSKQQCQISTNFIISVDLFFLVYTC